ncbi:lamin tail domain-containing protein [Archangium sp.]|uniref:lamin tail domain-containing protein n=1 Tax=Archangium sp. TaxID=1872627 RepID=UPI00389B09C4
MMHGPPTLTRLVAWSVLLLGLTSGCGASCGGDPVTPPPVTREMPDADRSSVAVSKALGVRANGTESVGIQVTVRKADGTALAGRTVKVSVSGEGNTVTQPAGSTDDEGVATAKLTSTAAGTKKVTVSVEAEGGPVTLSSQPTVEFVVLPASKLAFTSAPASGTAGATLGVFEVTLQNADGETMTDASSTVTVALASGPAAATLKGTASAVAVNGVARFSELVLEKAGEGYMLVANAEGLTGAASPIFTVAPAAAASLAVTASAEPVMAGSAASLEVVVRDAFGNEAVGYTGTVGFSSDDALATLPADYTFTAADLGRHTFTDLVLKQVGTRSVTVQDSVDAALTDSVELAVVPGAASQLVFTQQPRNHSVRAPFGVQVVLADAFGNRVLAGAPAVSLSLNNGGTLAGLVSVAPVDGVASFSGLSIAEENSGYVLTASAAGGASGLSEAFTIIDDVKPSVPGLAQTGATPTSLTVRWTAVGDDGDAGIASGYDLRYSTAPIASDMDFDAATPVSLGVRVPQPAGSIESATLTGLTQGTTYYVALRVTDNAGNAALSASLMASTPSPTASKLAFTVQPKSGTAGTPLATIQVEIQDADGLVVGNATSAVALTVKGVTGFDPSPVAAVNGVATFTNVRIDKAGTGYTLEATSSGLTLATSTSFDIAPAAAASLELSGLPSTVVARTEQSVTVTVRDAYGNLAEGYTGTVSFASSDAAATSPASYAFTAADKGQHTLPGVILRTEGSQSLTVSAPGLTDGKQTTEVTAAPAGKLVLTGLPSEVISGDTVSVTVEVLDGFGARDTAYTGTVHFTSSDARAVLPADYAFTGTDAGLKTFSVKLLTAGAPSATTSLTVTDTVKAAYTATASTTVKWSGVAKLVLESPDTAKAGTPVSVKVSALDAQDNLVKDYSGTVAFSADADQAVLPADYAFTPTDSGSRLFSVTLKKAVSTKLTVTDAANSLSDSHTLAVSAESASELVLVVSPTGPVLAGTALSFDVTLKDSFGNLATGYRGTLGFTSNDAQAVLPASTPFTSTDAGHKAFSVTLKTAGADQTVSLQDGASPFLAATAHVQVDPNTPAKLAFVAQPTNARVRTALAPVSVRITDTYGNTVNTGTPDVTVALAGGNASAVLSGTQPVKPVAGIATFTDLSVDQQGTGFRLDAMGGSLNGASSNTFTITDDIAPATVSLSVSDKTSTQLALSWTAPGDDVLVGDSTSYDLRYSTSPITAANFDAVTASLTGLSQPRGSTESVLVTGLKPSTQYYFALRIKDDATNASLSFANAADTTTNVDPCAGYVCPVTAPTCAPDGVSRITYTETCVDVSNTATCQESQTSTACTGSNAVCFNGTCDTAAKPAANQLLVTEVMHSPSSTAATPATEYFEVTNTTSNLLNLSGLTVTYKNAAGTPRSFLVDAGGVPQVIGRKGTFVLASDKNTATNGGVSASYQYPGTIVLDGSGQITLVNGGTTVTDFGYTSSFPQTAGKAMSLSSLIVGTRSDGYPWYWCDSDVLLSGGDYGSPNAANSACGMTATPSLNFCNIQSPKTVPSTPVGTPITITSQFRGVSVTDRNMAGNDMYPFVFAELGYGTASTSATTWTWAPIAYDGSYSPPVSDYDQTVGTLTIGTAGSYNYGFRYYFKDPVTGTASAYVYCDANGIAAPASGVFGTVTITSTTPPGIANHVVISEFSGGNGTGTAATDEFIELYNPTDSPVDLNGWTVQYKSATGTTYSSSVTIPAGTFIQPKKYFLLGGANYSGTGTAAKDLGYTFDTSASTTAGGHVRIGPGLDPANANDPKTVDKLGWGTGNSPEGTAAPAHPAVGGSLERKAVSTSTSATMAVGGTDASRGNGYDTDNNSTDFVTRAARQPQSSTSATETP